MATEEEKAQQAASRCDLTALGQHVRDLCPCIDLLRIATHLLLTIRPAEKGTVFDKIISKEIQANILYEDDQASASLPYYP